MISYQGRYLAVEQQYGLGTRDQLQIGPIQQLARLFRAAGMLTREAIVILIRIIRSIRVIRDVRVIARVGIIVVKVIY